MPPDGDLPEVNINALRGHILGVSLDNTLTPGVDDWFITTGAASNRNALTGAERIITKVLNNLNSSATTALAGVDGFNDRFSLIIGNEGSTEKQAFEKIGSNLINAIVNLQDLSKDLVGLPDWNADDYVLKFRTGAGDEVEVNLPLESLAQGMDYDPIEKEIILIKHDGSEIRVSIADLVALYEGANSSTVTTEVSIDNKITATIVLQSIGEEHLTQSLLDTIANSASISGEMNNILERKADGLYVPRETQVQVSAKADNLIETQTDGIYVAPISGDRDNYVGQVIFSEAEDIEKAVISLGSQKPAAYLTGQLYSILFPKGHAASSLRLSFDNLPFRDVYFNGSRTIPKNLIKLGSMQLFVDSGSQFVYVGQNYEMTIRGIFTTNELPPYQSQATIPITEFIPVTSDIEPTFDSTILDNEGRIGRVVGISASAITVYTIKEAYYIEHPIDHYSIVYDETETMQAIRLADNVKNSAVGKVTNLPDDLAQTELSISTSANNQRLISVKKDDGTVAWQLRLNKGQITTVLNINDEDDLMNKGQIEDLIRESAGTGLRIPIFIDIEEELPPIDINTPDGTYYMVADMTITAPGSEGRVWYNKEVNENEYQVFVTRGRDLDWDWIIADEHNDISFNTDKIIMTTHGLDMQQDTGKISSINALMEIDSKIANTFQGDVDLESELPDDALNGYWYMVRNCDISSNGNAGLAVFKDNIWYVSGFEASLGHIEFIPEPNDDGNLYFRSLDGNSTVGKWVEFKEVNGLNRTITMNVKHSDTDSGFVPLKGELVYLEDINNFIIGDGVKTVETLPRMYVPEATFSLGYTAEDVANRAQPHGYAPLDDNAKIPSLYLPETLVETYTKTEIDSKILTSQTTLQLNINSEILNRQTADNLLEAKIDNHINDANIHVTSTEKTFWDNKLDSSDLLTFETHITDPDVHVTWAEKQKWNGYISAHLVTSTQEMYNIPISGLQLGDTCFVRLTAEGITPIQYDKYVWYGATTGGWNKETGAATIIDLDWGGIKNKPVSSITQIDLAVSNSHKHNNINSLNKISELSGLLAYNSIPLNTPVLFYSSDSQLPQRGEELHLYVVYTDKRSNNHPTLSIWRDNRYEIVSGSSVGAPSPVGNMLIQQRELLGVLASSEFLLEVVNTPNYAFLPIEILRMIEGAKGQIRNYSNFTNANGFVFNSDLLKLQNGVVMGPFDIAMQRYNQITGTYYYQKKVDITNYHSVEEIY